MVRTGVVQHPSLWAFGGYDAIQNPKQRYSIVNRGELAKLLGIRDDVQMMEVHRQWVEALLKTGSNKRDAQWTESIAVGNKDFVMETKARLGTKGVGRKITGENSQYELREPQIPYSPLLTLEKCDLSDENSYFWDVFHKNLQRQLVDYSALWMFTRLSIISFALTGRQEESPPLSKVKTNWTFRAVLISLAGSLSSSFSS